MHARRFTREMLLAMALVTLAAPAFAQKDRDRLIQIQADMTRLIQAQRDLQRAVDEKHAILKTLVEQSLDSINKLNTTLAGIQATQANLGSRTDNLATQVQALADTIDEMKSRMSKLNQQLAETQNVLQSVDAKLAPPVSGGGGSSGPPPSADVLYPAALRDYTGGKYDLAKQEFQDYLKYYGETDLASNAQFYLGEIAYAQKDYQTAVTEYDKVLDNYPKSFKLADARLKKGLALLEMNQRASGTRELREVVRRHPGSDAEKRARAKLRELGILLPSGKQ